MRLRLIFLTSLLSLSARASELAQAPKQLILPGQTCAACATKLVLPASVAMPPSAIPSWAGAPVDLSLDGDPVSPRIIIAGLDARHDPTVPAIQATAKGVERALPALSESVRLGDWNGPGTDLNQSCCGDAAPKLGLMLRNMGYGLHVVEADMHYYLLQTLAGGHLIVDPTIRQFFGGARAPPSVPTVFVGSDSDLHGLFRAHAAAKTTGYGVQKIYYSGAQIKDKKMRELQHALGQDPPRVDMLPLADFLKDLKTPR